MLDSTVLYDILLSLSKKLEKRNHLKDQKFFDGILIIVIDIDIRYSELCISLIIYMNHKSKSL